MAQTVLILGGSGRFGSHCAKAFAARGWIVRQFDREKDVLWDAAWGADVIVNGWHMPPERWKAHMVPTHQSVQDVAEASGATVILPGNVYPYGAGMPEILGPDTPRNPTTLYCRLRQEIEQNYRSSKARVIILRAGDFLDDRPSDGWFDQIITAKLSKGRIVYPGPLDRAHAWAYLPDLARVAVALAERRATLPRFVDVPYPGLTLTGRELIEHLSKIHGQTLRPGRFAWLPLRVAAPVWPLAHFLVAMRYLWKRPHRLDPKPLADLLPDHKDSDVLTALAAATQHQISPDQTVAGQPLATRSL